MGLFSRKKKEKTLAEMISSTCFACQTKIETVPYLTMIFTDKNGERIEVDIHNSPTCNNVERIKKIFPDLNYVATGMTSPTEYLLNNPEQHFDDLAENFKESSEPKENDDMQDKSAEQFHIKEDSSANSESGDAYNIAKIKGEEYHRNGEFEKALAEYDKILSEKPEQADILFLSIDTLVALSKYNLALKRVNKLIELKPDIGDILATKALIFHQLGRYEEAVNVCNESLKKDHTDMGILNIKGMDLMILNRFDEAKKCYQRQLEIDPYDDHVNGVLQNFLQKTVTT